LHINEAAEVLLVLAGYFEGAAHTGAAELHFEVVGFGAEGISYGTVQISELLQGDGTVVIDLDNEFVAGVQFNGNEEVRGAFQVLLYDVLHVLCGDHNGLVLNGM
jgi:hypothetical protein